MAEPGQGAGARRQSSSSRKVPRSWQHPSSSLVKGSIVYNAKLWGKVEVTQPNGAVTVKAAIDALSAYVQEQRQRGIKATKVTLAVSFKGIRTTDAKTKVMMHMHSLGAISYAGDDKTTKSVFAYIVRDDTTNKFFCYAYKADGMASQISLTVAQAFDVALKEYKKTLGPGKEKISKQMETAQTQVADAATAGGASTQPPPPKPADPVQQQQAPAAVQPPPPVQAAAPVVEEPPPAPATENKLLSMQGVMSIDEPSDQGYFEPFNLAAPEQMPAPVFGPGIDDIDDAIKNIEDQIGGLVEGFGAGFALDSA